MVQHGSKLAHYEVVSAIGRGGMGEVWRARDAKLGREVAIKTLPEEFANDRDRLARFEREARLLAALNHPHIAAIYGLEEHEGNRFLVLELVDGETLAERIGRGPLPVDQALAIALEIAEALEAAHGKGVIHRDLKPANVKLTEDGTVKVLDFGLAKALAGEASDARVSQSPTLSMAATRQGIILGTAAYMSPEQARGHEVDKRTDIWAFGCVLFEMLTARQAFSGTNVTDILAAIVRAEPEWTALPAGIEPRLRELLERCLEKDPKQRWHDIADVRLGIEAVQNRSPDVVVDAPSSATARFIPWAFVALLGVVLTWVLLQSNGPSPPDNLPTAVHLQLVLPESVHLDLDSEHAALALSPDGSRMVYVGEANGTARLYVQELAGGEPRVIEGTEGAASPFFSPDGTEVGFWIGSTLYRVSAVSGIPVAISTLVPTSVNHGAAWLEGDVLVMGGSANEGLSRTRLPESGTLAREDWTLLPGAPYHWPSAVGGASSVLFTDKSTGILESARVAAMQLNTETVTPIVDGGTSPRYSPTGHVLFARAGSLYGVGFDAGRNEVTGSEIRLIDGIVMNARGAAQFAVAANGILAYVAGDMMASEDELVWVGRETGATEVILDDGRRYQDPRLSPDGERLAFMIPDGPNLDVWVLDLGRGDLTRWTSHPGEDFSPIWRPTDQTLAFATEIGEDSGEGGPALGYRASPGAPPEQLLRRPGEGNWEFPGSWSPDGQWLAFGATNGGDDDRNLYVLDFETREALPFLVTPDREFAPMFHPSGDWIAFVSDRSGREQVYVLPFPGGGEPVSLSPGGGMEPVWARNGEELYFRQAGRLMVVTFGDGPGDPNAPEVLLDDGFQRQPFGDFAANYDVSPDGGRFVMIRPKSQIQPKVIDVIVNWPEALGVVSELELGRPAD